MIQWAALILLHVICLYFLQLLWRDKHNAIQRGTVFTKMGLVSKRKSPRLFRFSVWVDFVALSLLYAGLITYSIFLLIR